MDGIVAGSAALTPSGLLARLEALWREFEAMPKIVAKWQHLSNRPGGTWGVSVPDRRDVVIQTERFAQAAREAATALAAVHNEAPAADGLATWLDHLKDFCEGKGAVEVEVIEATPDPGEPYIITKASIAKAQEWSALAVRELLAVLRSDGLCERADWLQVRTVGDLWKALQEGKSPAVAVSAISLRPPYGPNIVQPEFPKPADQLKWDVLDRVLALCDAEGGDRAEAMRKLIARVALAKEVERREIVNMPLATFVEATAANAPSDARQDRPGAETTAGIEAPSEPPGATAESNNGGTRPDRKWQEVAAELEKLRMNGAPFKSQGGYAKELHCSPATVNKAIANTPSLRDWADRPISSTTWGGGIDGAILDSTPQKRETDPANIVEPADADAALAYLIEHASPEERARIHAMAPDQQRQLATLAYNDPDREKRILEGD